MAAIKITQMNTRIWTHENVNKKGIIKSGGGVQIKPGIYTSIFHSCTLKSCKCSKDHWVCINFGYDKKRKSVSGITFYFQNDVEFSNFMINKYLD